MAGMKVAALVALVLVTAGCVNPVPLSATIETSATQQTTVGSRALAADASAFDCGDVGAGATASFLIVGTAKEAGTFHYELALRELVRPFDYVNEHPDGADVHIWDETVTPK